MAKKYVKIIKGSFCIISLILGIDLLLIYGGQNTILLKYSPGLLDAARVLAIFWAVLVIFTAIKYISDQKWKKLIAMFAMVFILLTAAKITLTELMKNATDRAYSIAQMILSEKKINFSGKVDEALMEDYKKITKGTKPYNISPYYSIPLAGRYAFIITSNDIEPVILSLTISDNDTSYMIYRRGSI